MIDRYNQFLAHFTRFATDLANFGQCMANIIFHNLNKEITFATRRQSRISPFSWINLSQVLWRVDCHDKFAGVLGATIDDPESTL